MKKIFILIIAMFYLSNDVVAQDKPQEIKAEDYRTKPKVRIISDDPVIHLDRDVLDYGTITKGSDRVRKFKVINRGGKPLVIKKCQGSCGCTVPKCPSQPIMPGGIAEITVNYDTNRMGAINKSVTISSNDPKSPKKYIRIRGTVTKPATPNSK